jgi:hypothetical protein
LLLYLGLAALDRDRYERMVALLEEGMVLFRKLGDKYGVGVCCYTMGIAALDMGDPECAAALLEEAMHALQQLGDKVAIFHCLLGAAGVAGSRGEPARVARLWGAAEALGEAFAVTVLPAIRAHYDYGGLLAAARAGTDKLAWEAAWAEGRAMTPEQAVEYALEPRPEEPNSPPAYPAGLSAREVEVLKLVAKGMTNAQIATELYISHRKRSPGLHLPQVRLFHPRGGDPLRPGARSALIPLRFALLRVRSLLPTSAPRRRSYYVR